MALAIGTEVNGHITGHEVHEDVGSTVACERDRQLVWEEAHRLRVFSSKRQLRQVVSCDSKIECEVRHLLLLR